MVFGKMRRLIGAQRATVEKGCTWRVSVGKETAGASGCWDCSWGWKAVCPTCCCCSDEVEMPTAEDEDDVEEEPVPSAVEVNELWVWPKVPEINKTRAVAAQIMALEGILTQFGSNFLYYLV